jgi:hypothetical protein
VPDELANLGICVHGFVKLSCRCSDHDTATNRVLTLHFILSAALVRDVLRVLSMND